MVTACSRRIFHGDAGHKAREMQDTKQGSLQNLSDPLPLAEFYLPEQRHHLGTKC